jgi:hypothetical protein
MGTSQTFSHLFELQYQMILTENNINEHSIKGLIGERTNIEPKKLKAIGSASFFLKSFVNKSDKTDLLRTDSKCNFEKYSDGLLLRANFSNRLTAIPIPKTKLNSIHLIRGEETIDPFFLSPMWVLLKLGTSKLIARYFRFRLHEYSIGEMELKLKTKHYEMEFIANGYIFERQKCFFEGLGYGEKITIIEKPVANNTYSK